jgi:ABC-type transport system involved in cytochrome c biogenesis permease subunit
MTPEEILVRDVFLLGIELKIYWLVALSYGVCFFIGVAYLISSNPGTGKALTRGLRLTAVIHTLLIIFRTYEGMRPPFQSLYEALSFFAWSSNLTYLYAQSRWRAVHLPGFIVSGIAMGACLYGAFTRSPVIDPIPPALQSPWYEVHVITAFMSYAVFVVSFSVEACYLRFRTPPGAATGIFGAIDEDFRRWTHRLVLFGFPFLTFAIFSGAAWANDAWGRYWSWDPMETWSLITWTVYAIYLHSKTIRRWKNTPASVLNILGFVCMIMTFLGKNWLVQLFNIPSLHSYAV